MYHLATAGKGLAFLLQKKQSPLRHCTVLPITYCSASPTAVLHSVVNNIRKIRFARIHSTLHEKHTVISQRYCWCDHETPSCSCVPAPLSALPGNTKSITHITGHGGSMYQCIVIKGNLALFCEAWCRSSGMDSSRTWHGEGPFSYFLSAMGCLN